MRNLARAMPTSWRAGIDSAGWIHLNAAGASPSPALVHDAIVKHLDLERTVGGYAAAARVEREPHAAVAALLNCAADEIALAESAQAGWARAFYSLAFRPNDRILTWESEYAGNAVAMLQVAERTGAQLEVLPMRADGVADVEALERALSATPPGASTLVALTHVQTESSVVQPAERVGAACRAAGGDTLYMLDACQTAGILPLDVEALGCDFLAATGRKWLRGPRGTGFLYARRGALAPGGSRLVGEPPMVDHTSVRWTSSRSYEVMPTAARYEMWESSIAGRAGLAAACDFVREEVGVATAFELACARAAELREGLAKIPGLTLRDAPPSFGAAAEAAGARRCAIVTFDVAPARTAAEVAAALDAKKIGVSVSPSFHTFDDAQWARPPVVRLSPSYFTTEEEVESVVAAVAEAVSGR